MFTLLILLAVIYIFLKVSNTRAEFARRDAEREAREREAEALSEELEEEADIRESAIDVDAEVIDPDSVEFEVVEPGEGEPIPQPIEVEDVIVEEV